VSAFGTISLAPILLDLSFYIVTDASSIATNMGISLLSETFIVNAQKGDMFSIIMNAGALFLFMIMMPYTILTFLLKIFTSATIMMLRNLGLKSDFMAPLFKAFVFIDMVLSIICPFIWIISAVNLGKEKKPQKPEKKPKEEVTTEGKTA
jgi:predicted membrane protein